MAPSSTSSSRQLSVPQKTLLVFSAVAVALAALVSYPTGSMFQSRSSRRLSLAQAVAQKTATDEKLLAEDKSLWYRLHRPDVIPPDALSRFLELDFDADSRTFIEASIDKSDWLFTQLWHNLAIFVLSFFYSKTDINGLLGRGSMFVLSRGQFELLVGDLLPSPRLPSMIDLGAGDGTPTEAFSASFDRTYATEASSAMRRSLDARGITVLDIDTWHDEPNVGRFDLISCLNLLDRCDAPLSILRQIKSALKRPDGLVVVALVLPFRPYVEFSPQGSHVHKPTEKLLENDAADPFFEEQIGPLFETFRKEGLEVVRWTRVPYLCEGDLARSIYRLDDAVFVLKHREE